MASTLNTYGIQLFSFEISFFTLWPAMLSYPSIAQSSIHRIHLDRERQAKKKRNISNNIRKLSVEKRKKKKKLNPIFIIILVCMSKYMIKWVCNIHSMNSFVDYIMMILPLYVAYIYCFITLRLHVCVQRQILAKLTCTLPSTYNIISHFNLRVNDRWQDLSNGMILLASGKGHIADPKHRNKKKTQKKNMQNRGRKKKLPGVGGWNILLPCHVNAQQLPCL